MGEHHGNDDLDFKQFKEKVMKEGMLGTEDAKVAEEVIQKKFKELDKLHSNLGATGKFPHGKLTRKDEGEIKFSVGLSMDKKRVVLNFGKAVRWVGMSRNQALDVSRAIEKTANETAK